MLDSSKEQCHLLSKVVEARIVDFELLLAAGAAVRESVGGTDCRMFVDATRLLVKRN